MDDKRYKFFLIAFFVILTLPLLTSPAWLHPAPWGKAILFRIIMSVLLFFLVWQILKGTSKGTEFLKLRNSVPLNRKNKVFWPFWLLIALWLIFLLATIFSQDPYYSFWESPYRGGGFLNFSLYIISALLAFLIIKEKDWPKIWNFCLVIGFLTSLIGILQSFHIFSQRIVPYIGGPPSTFGNSMFFSIYLLFLVFIALSFAVKEKRPFKKILYFSLIPLFAFAILLTEARAVYLGLMLGAVYFFIFYPIKSVKGRKKILLLKIATIIAVISVIAAVYFVNTREQLPQFIENNRVLKRISSRLSLDLLIGESRFSTWKVALKAVKEKPILGWGLENFAIAFDKYYDPKLPGLPGIWWDRTHNFMLDIAATAGIPALIIYLSLFGVLFWQLQKLKKKSPDKGLICHTIQAIFIGYLAADFFSFDNFSTYLISFLLIAYCLSLLKPAEELSSSEELSSLPLWKSGFVSGLFCLLIVFIWFAALKPLKINKEINYALHYSKNKQCEKAIEKMDSVLPLSSNIDSYLRLQYTEIIKTCLQENIERKYVLGPKIVSILRELKEIRPYYTRTWICLGNYLNVLIENKKALKIENVEELKKEADAAFERANQLSPKREEVFPGWILTKILSEDYQGAKEKAEQCINFNQNTSYCWWKKTLAHIYLREFEQADEAMLLGDPNSKEGLFQLHKAYLKVLETIEDKEKEKELYLECHKRIANIYERLIVWDIGNFQYYASLAHCYKILGDYKKAEETALLVIDLAPQAQADIEEFFKSILLLDNDYCQYHLYLAKLYHKLGKSEQAKQHILIAKQYALPGSQADEEIKVWIRRIGI